VGNFLSFCLRSPQVSIQLVSLTWQGGLNLANQYRTPQNASRAATIKLNRRMYSHRKINFWRPKKQNQSAAIDPPCELQC